MERQRAAQIKNGWSKRLSTLVSYLLALIYALLIVVPIYYVVISSFKDNSQIFSAPLALPKFFDFGNYLLAQERVNMLRAMGVSAQITVVALIINLSLGYLAAYAIARIETKVARWFEAYFSMGFLIPVFAVIVPVFLLAAKTGLLYKPIFVMLFYAGSRLPITIVILSSQIRQIPQELEDTAKIDGANRLQTIFFVFFPLSRAAVVTVLVMNFISFWNEYLFALILLAGDTRTVQLVVPLLRSERLVDYGLVAAGIVISMVPIYIIFILFEEQIVTGLMGGAVKQ